MFMSHSGLGCNLCSYGIGCSSNVSIVQRALYALKASYTLNVSFFGHFRESIASHQSMLLLMLASVGSSGSSQHCYPGSTNVSYFAGK